MKKNKRGAIELDELVYWILGILVFILVIGIFILLRGKGVGAIEYLRDLLRFGG